MYPALGKGSRMQSVLRIHNKKQATQQAVREQVKSKDTWRAGNHKDAKITGSKEWQWCNELHGHSRKQIATGDQVGATSQNAVEHGVAAFSFGRACSRGACTRCLAEEG